MVHDFIVTENHVLFPILPLTGSMDRAMSGRPPYAWEPEKGSCVGVMKRNGAAKDIVWFRGEACYVFHVMNAWEDGNRIIADVMQFEEAPLFPHPDGRRTDPQKSRARLCRWTFDLSGNTDRFTRDLSRRRHRRISAHRRPQRRSRQHATAGTPAPARIRISSAGSRASMHVDAKTRARLAQYMLPEGDTISEPVFVERGEGCRRGRRLAARRRLARARKPQRPGGIQRHRRRQAARWRWCNSAHRVPDGFHGNWVGAS